MQKTTNSKLIAYTKAYANIALTKRMGFLAELLHEDKLQAFVIFAKTQLNKRYSLLDAGGMEQGEFVNEWKLRLNVSKENIMQMTQTTY